VTSCAQEVTVTRLNAALGRCRYANYVTMESQHEAARRREKVLAL
jgi:hypothetical protein